jgi:3-hydroxybutyryl-CoA dehydrogenase
MAMAIRKVGVLGCGLMGSGIAQVCAQAGYDTVVREVEQKFLDKGLGGIDKNLSRAVEKGKLSTTSPIATSSSRRSSRTRSSSEKRTRRSTRS